jgi:hypothetical protein
MSYEQAIADCIIEAVSRSPGCLLEELALDCPGLTWNQVFVEIARMSEEGKLILEGIGPGFYIVKLPARAETLQRHRENRAASSLFPTL